MAYTVLDSKNIDKKKNIYTFGGSGTKPEREDIAENSKLIDYSSGEKYYYDPTKAAGSKWQPDKEPSGGGSGGSLPANFPKEDSANANKFLGFDANGDYTAKDAPSGGGSEKFVVTLTQDAQTEEWTADKTAAEVYEAYAAGADCICRFPYDEDLFGELRLFSAFSPDEGVEIVQFTGTFGEDALVALNILLVTEGGNEVCEVRQLELPYGTTDGETLMWDAKNSKWFAGTNPNAPLIVTLTAGAAEGQFVGDKTYKEVYDAFISGKTCLFNMTISDSSAAESFVINNAAFSEGNYSMGSGDVSVTGAANDYITIMGD